MKRQLLLPEGFIYMSPLHNCNVMGTLPLSYSLIPELVKTFLACTRAVRKVLQVTSAARSQQAKPLLSWLTLCAEEQEPHPAAQPGHGQQLLQPEKLEISRVVCLKRCDV